MQRDRSFTNILSISTDEIEIYIQKILLIHCHDLRWWEGRRSLSAVHAPSATTESASVLSTNDLEVDAQVSKDTIEEKPKKRKPGSPGMYQRIEMPSPESMAQEDFHE